MRLEHRGGPWGPGEGPEAGTVLWARDGSDDILSRRRLMPSRR